MEFRFPYVKRVSTGQFAMKTAGVFTAYEISRPSLCNVVSCLSESFIFETSRPISMKFGNGGALENLSFQFKFSS